MRIDKLSPERWKRVKAIADLALDATSALERSEIIARECAGDAELLEGVEEVCRRFSESHDLLGCAPLSIGALQESPMEPGDLAGAYRIERQLGRGGMGYVYLASRADDAYSKNVAIKTLSRGVEPQLLELFLNERRTLAVLDHPNITRILDAGTTSKGVPYVVMEYVDGVPVTEYLRDRPEKEVLRKFQEVCEALEHAHQHTILHCDLKPSNILVSAKGEVKVLDFGLSQVAGNKALGLTANYASPEQAKHLPVTIRSDVYSLGVLLRELTEQQRSPDVAAIVGKATQQLAANRYSSARALSEDIQRYLKREPVEAQQGGFGYRAGLYIQRHGWQFAGGMGLSLAVLLGLAGTITQKRAAERHFEDVRGLAKSVIFDYQKELAKIQGSTALRARIAADTVQYLDKIAQDVQGDPAMQLEIATAYRMVGEAQGYQHAPNIGNLKGGLESLNKSVAILTKLQAKDPNLSRELAISLERQANLLGLSGRNRQARAAAQQAIDLLTGRDDDVSTELSASWRELSAALINLGVATEAAAAAQKAVWYGRNSKSRECRALAFLQLSRSTLMGIGPNQQSLESAQAAVKEYRECAPGAGRGRSGPTATQELSRRPPLPASSQEDSDCAAGYLAAMAALARHYAYADESEEGIRTAQKAEDVALAALSNDPHDRRLLRQLRYAQSLHGDNLRDLGVKVPAATPKALAKYRASMQTAERMVKDDPSHPDGACQVIASKARYGEVLIQVFHKVDEAEIQLKESVRVADALTATDSMPCLDSRKMAVINLARVAEARGDWEGGMEWRRETVRNAVRYANRSPGEPLSLVIEAGANYELGLGGLAAAEHGDAAARLGEAKKALLRALEVYRELKKLGNPIQNQYRGWPEKTAALLARVEEQLSRISR